MHSFLASTQEHHRHYAEILVFFSYVSMRYRMRKHGAYAYDTETAALLYFSLRLCVNKHQA